MIPIKTRSSILRARNTSEGYCGRLCGLDQLEIVNAKSRRMSQTASLPICLPGPILETPCYPSIQEEQRSANYSPKSKKYRERKLYSKYCFACRCDYCCPCRADCQSLILELLLLYLFDYFFIAGSFRALPIDNISRIDFCSSRRKTVQKTFLSCHNPYLSIWLSRPSLSRRPHQYSIGP